jgi:predicted oxidoreductase (fatty acid repression mutant protein)
VYRKPTATERYITIDLHHCVQHKSATFNSMVNRLFTIPMSAVNQLKDLKKIKLAKIMDILRNWRQNSQKTYKGRQFTTLATLTKNEGIPRAAITYYPAITKHLQKTQNYFGLLQHRKNQ